MEIIIFIITNLLFLGIWFKFGVQSSIKQGYNQLEKEIQNDIIDNVEKNIENNNFISIINNFLKEKFINVIQIFNMPKKEYESEFKLKNNFLLECNEKIKNKKILKDLIQYGVVKYLKKKKERK